MVESGFGSPVNREAQQLPDVLTVLVRNIDAQAGTAQAQLTQLRADLQRLKAAEQIQLLDTLEQAATFAVQSDGVERGIGFIKGMLRNHGLQQAEYHKLAGIIMYAAKSKEAESQKRAGFWHRLRDRVSSAGAGAKTRDAAEPQVSSTTTQTFAMQNGEYVPVGRDLSSMGGIDISDGRISKDSGMFIVRNGVLYFVPAQTTNAMYLGNTLLAAGSEIALQLPANAKEGRFVIDLLRPAGAEPVSITVVVTERNFSITYPTVNG